MLNHKSFRQLSLMTSTAYRVAKTHTIPYLYRSFPAKVIVATIYMYICLYVDPYMYSCMSVCNGLGNVSFLEKIKRVFATVHGPGPNGSCASCWYGPLRVQKLTLSVFNDVKSPGQYFHE